MGEAVSLCKMAANFSSVSARLNVPIRNAQMSLCISRLFKLNFITETPDAIKFIGIKKNSCTPIISYTKVSNKMAYANSADPDQTAPEGAV